MASEVVFTIGTSIIRDYTSFTAYDAVNARNLVAADEYDIVACYDDGEMTDTVSFSAAWVTDSTHYVHIMTPASERHNGTINTGFHIKNPAAAPFEAFGDPEDLIIDGLEIEATSGNDRCIYATGGSAGHSITVKNCLFQCAASSANVVQIGRTGSVIVDNNKYNWINVTSGTFVNTLGASETLTFTNNEMTGLTGDFGYFLYSNVATEVAVISGNTVSHTGDFNYCFYTGNCASFTASNNTITYTPTVDGWNTGYRISSVGAVSISGSTVSMTGEYSSSVTIVACTGATLYDNSLTGGATDYWQNVYVRPESGVTKGGVTIYNNTFVVNGTNVYNLVVDGCVDADIYGNTFQNNCVDGYAIFLHSLYGDTVFSGDAHIYKNKISRIAAGGVGTAYGIYTFDGDNIYIYNNMVVNFQYAGYCDGNPTSIIVYFNSAYNNGHGFWSANTDIVYKNNYVACRVISTVYNDYDSGQIHADSEYNASLAGAGSSFKAPGANSIYGIAPADNFTSLVADSEDLHIVSTDADIYDVGVDLSADPYLIVTDDYDGDSRSTDMGADEYVLAATPYTVDIDEEIMIISPYTVDIDEEMMIIGAYTVDIDEEIKIEIPIPTTGFLVYDPDESIIYDYTNRVLGVGLIRRFLNKEFGISQVGNVSIVCENSDKAHSYIHADGDFYPSSRYIWTWAKFTCGWGVGLDQNVQAQFQGLVETLELTEKREANFVIVDIIKELLNGKLANATTFDAALVASTSLESLNPVHIVEYLINDVLGVQVFDFDAEAFVDGAEPTSFDQAYTDSSTVVVNDTTWPAGSSIIEMIQDALKLVQGWIYTGGDGRIKAKVFTNPAPTGSEKHFIGSETDSDRKIMNLRLHPSRRDIINYVTWTYGQAGSPYGPDYDATSIGQYGYRPLALTTGWEVNTNILDDVSNELTSRYSQPPDMITFSTSNLYGSGDGLDAEIGEVIKVTDDGIGLADAYFRIIEKRDDLLGRKTDIVAEEYVGT